MGFMNDAGQKSLKFAEDKLWNDLPDEARSATSIYMFKSHVKKYIIDKQK